MGIVRWMWFSFLNTSNTFLFCIAFDLLNELILLLLIHTKIIFKEKLIFTKNKEVEYK